MAILFLWQKHSLMALNSVISLNSAYHTSWLSNDEIQYYSARDKTLDTLSEN